MVVFCWGFPIWLIREMDLCSFLIFMVVFKWVMSLYSSTPWEALHTWTDFSPVRGREVVSLQKPGLYCLLWQTWKGYEAMELMEGSFALESTFLHKEVLGHFPLLQAASATEVSSVTLAKVVSLVVQLVCSRISITWSGYLWIAKRSWGSDQPSLISQASEIL